MRHFLQTKLGTQYSIKKRMEMCSNDSKLSSQYSKSENTLSQWLLNFLGPISINLSTKHHWVQEIRILQIKDHSQKGEKDRSFSLSISVRYNHSFTATVSQVSDIAHIPPVNLNIYHYNSNLKGEKDALERLIVLAVMKDRGASTIYSVEEKMIKIDKDYAICRRSLISTNYQQKCWVILPP